MPERVWLGIYLAAMNALIVSSCILTRKPKRGPLKLWPAAGWRRSILFGLVLPRRVGLISGATGAGNIEAAFVVCLQKEL
jgi:hypothetical protein